MRVQGSRAGDRRERQSSRHLLYRLEGCRYQERKGSRRRRREREMGREGGRTGMMTGPKPREAACASLVTSGSVLGLPTRPKAHQCLVCVSGTSSGPPPLLLLGRSEASHQLVPHVAGYRARRQPLPPAPVAAEKKKNPTGHCPFVWEQ